MVKPTTTNRPMPCVKGDRILCPHPGLGIDRPGTIVLVTTDIVRVRFDDETFGTLMRWEATEDRRP